MTDLTSKSCEPCEGGVPPLKPEEIEPLEQQVDDGWQVIDHHHIERTFDFDDFKQALAFTNKVGEIAEQEGHHPDFYLTYGEVKLSIWTHAIDGLTENDFILAAKVDEVY